MRRAETNYDAQDQYAWKNHRHHRLGRFALTQTPGGAAPPPPPPVGGRQGYSHKFTNSQTVKRRPGIETRENIQGHPRTFVMNLLQINVVCFAKTSKSSKSFTKILFLLRWRFAFRIDTNSGGGHPPGPPPLGDSQGYSHKFTNSQTVKR